MCLYFKRDAGGITVVGVYVDDLLVTGTSQKRVEEFFDKAKELQIKNLGRLKKLLGIRATERSDGLLGASR